MVTQPEHKSKPPNDVCHAAAVPGMEVGKEYTIVLRPEAAALAEEGGLPCEVILSCFMGSYQNYHVKVGDTVVKLTDPNPKNKRIFNGGENCFLDFARCWGGNISPAAYPSAPPRRFS